MKTGIELITEERRRQIEVEGWTAFGDWLNIEKRKLQAIIDKRKETSDSTSTTKA